MTSEPDFDYLGVDATTRAALTALCTEYVWRIDNGHAQTVPELFSDDGEWIGPWGTMAGRAALDEAWTARSLRTVRTRHMLTNLRFTQSAPDRALGQIGQIVFVADGPDPMRPTPSIVAENIDDYVCGPDGVWRIRMRRVAMLAE
jgi:hypothetical protein